MRTFLNILYISVSPGIVLLLYVPSPWHILGAPIPSLCATCLCLHSENHKADQVSSFQTTSFHCNARMLREFPITGDVDPEIPGV